ncbi:MAG: hypothetical protein ACK55I_27170, partial [bacterium]
KREREQRLKDEQLAREAEAARLAEIKRLEREERDKLKIILEQEEFELTGGVKFLQTLRPYLIDGEDDRCIIPENCLSELNSQDAFGNGAAFFLLTSSTVDRGEKKTHCGVREFTAPEGQIGLPRKTINSLFTSSEDVSALPNVTIKYV